MVSARVYPLRRSGCRQVSRLIHEQGFICSHRLPTQLHSTAPTTPYTYTHTGARVYTYHGRLFKDKDFKNAGNYNHTFILMVALREKHEMCVIFMPHRPDHSLLCIISSHTHTAGASVAISIYLCVQVEKMTLIKMN